MIFRHFSWQTFWNGPVCKCCTDWVPPNLTCYTFHEKGIRAVVILAFQTTWLQGLRMVFRVLWWSEARRVVPWSETADQHNARATVLNTIYNMEDKIIKLISAKIAVKSHSQCTVTATRVEIIPRSCNKRIVLTTMWHWWMWPSNGPRKNIRPLG